MFLIDLFRSPIEIGAKFAGGLFLSCELLVSFCNTVDTFLKLGRCFVKFCPLGFEFVLFLVE